FPRDFLDPDDQVLRHDSRFGPLGTIGLQFEVVADLSLDGLDGDHSDQPPLPADPGSLPQALLWFGQCRKGTRLRIRLAHPLPSFGDFDFSHLHDLVELCIDDDYVIRFRNEIQGRKLYQVECSRAFLPGKDENDVGTLAFAEFEPTQEAATPVEGSAH